MRLRIDFSVFSSPVDAYGCVSGWLDLAAVPKVGDMVAVLDPDGSEDGVRLRVESLLVHEYDDSTTLMLADHLVDGRPGAGDLARRLEASGNLHVDVY